MARGIFVTGTDTGVGKTLTVALLARCFKYSDLSVKVLKPIQTGTNLPGMTDMEFVYKVLGESYEEESCIYALKEPLSPMVASMLEGVSIDTDYIVEQARRLQKGCDILIVEGAGGVLVPIRENYFMSNLMKDLRLPVVVVTRPGLGTLNHTFLTVRYLRSISVEVLGVVISGFPSNPGIAERTNPYTLEVCCDIDILGVIPLSEKVSVEEGEIGGLEFSCHEFFSPKLGGNFDKRRFMERLAAVDNDL